MKEDESLDCFGWLYEPTLIACNETCSVRTACKAKLEERFKQLGETSVEEMQKDLILKIENNIASTKLVNTSELVRNIVFIIESHGYTYRKTINYIVFNLVKTPVFRISNTKANSSKNLLKCVFTKKREEFPDDLIPKISTEKTGGFYTVEFVDFEDLRNFLRKYTEYLKR